ncbi:MAG: glycoside hydrolase family 31 protein, partial [Armatimonadetes bacterium]|nr:glycoside hydrolase family 31 protein [Armatimonadota bacterium]
MSFGEVKFGPRGLVATGDQRLEISYWSAGVLRVTWGKPAAEPSCRLTWLQGERRLAGQVAQAEDERTARLWLPAADRARVRLQKQQGQVEILSPAGEVLVTMRAGEGEAGRWRCSFSLGPEEELFGLGLQLHALRQRGRRRLLKINADPKDDSGSVHVAVPLLLSTGGYGVLVNTHEYTWWDLGRESDDRWWVEVPGEAMEVFLLIGSLREQVREYLALTGRPALPPKWGLGFWYRPKSGWDEAEVKSVLEEFRRRDLPCQVVGLEPSWQTHSYPCSYVWNRQQWPDPAEFVRWLDERGMKLNLWEHAYVHESSPIHEPLAEAGVVADAKVFGGLVPDFTLPQARELYLRLHQDEHLALGVAGYKLDECDGSDYTGGWFFTDQARFPGGLTGAQMHNIFGYLYQRTMHELFEGHGRRSYFLCRANYAGGQAFATCNYSDWYGFSEYVRLLANAGFAATPWCPEVRHLDDAEDFVRRSQVVFTSWLAMINAWSSGIRPWDKGEQAEAIFRRYAHLREQLLPYLYAEWEAQARTGLALTRALAVDFQDDPGSVGVDDQYMLGRWLMVAP